MALFKIFKGNATGKITDPNNPEYIQPTAATDGYAYYDTSTRKFYINADYNNDGTITRQPINAYHADGADAATLAQAAIYETTGEEGASVNSIRSYYAHNLSRSGDSIQLRNGLGIDIGNNIDISDKQDKNFIVDFYDRQYESDYVEGETKRYQVNFDLAEFRRVSALQFGKCNLQAKVTDIDQTFVYTNYYLITFIFFAIHVFYSIDISMEGLNLNSIDGIKYRYFAFADTGSNTIPDNNIYRGEITVPSEETIESYLSQALANYVTQNSLEEQLGDYPTWDDLDFALEDCLYNTDTAYKTASIPMGQVDSTSTATAFTATVDGITKLRDGVCVWLRNGIVTSAEGFTININNLGAKPCYSSLAAASRSTTIFNINYTLLLIYNSTRVEGGCWDIVYGIDSNTNTQMRVYRQTTGYNGDYPLLISRTQASGIGTAGSNGTYSAIYGVMWNDTTKVPTLNPSTGKMKVPGGIEGNASSATGFAAQKSITMTGAITGSGSGGNGSNGWSISTTIPDNSISNNKLTNNSINIAGTNVSLGGSINATTLTSSLGLTNAMHFIGVSSTTVTNGGNENPTISGYSTKTAGDVVLYGNQEFVYTTTNKWALLGDEGSYKIKQDAVNDPTASGSATTFISTITQDVNGVITATKKNLPSTMPPSSHTHGNITNDGKITGDGTAIGNGDRLVFVDATDSSNIIRKTDIAFDHATKTEFLSKEGSWISPIEYIEGTQTEITNQWTGITKDTSIYKGKVIAYHLPYASAPNENVTCSLTLTLDNGNGNTNGPTSVYEAHSGASGTSTIYLQEIYPAGTVLLLTYNGSRWQVINKKKKEEIPIPTTNQIQRPNSLQGTADVSLQSLFNVNRGNHFAFLPPDQIIIEKTTDGGATWTDAGISDSIKQQLFSESRPGGINIPLLNGVKNINCGLRITVTAMKYNVPAGTAETAKYNYWNSSNIKSTERYNTIRDIYFWVSSNSDRIKVKVERAKGSSSTTWETAFEDNSFGLTGWSGSNYVKLNFETVFGGGTTQTANYWNYRFTFFTIGKDGSSTLSTDNTTSQQTIYEIRAYGNNWWTKGNDYAAKDHIYSWDKDQNVSFPASLSFSNSSSKQATLNASSLTANRTFSFPDKAGTIALVSDIPTSFNTSNITGLKTLTIGSTTCQVFANNDITIPIYNGTYN